MICCLETLVCADQLQKSITKKSTHESVRRKNVAASVETGTLKAVEVCLAQEHIIYWKEETEPGHFGDSNGTMRAWRHVEIQNTPKRMTLEIKGFEKTGIYTLHVLVLFKWKKNHKVICASFREWRSENCAEPPASKTQVSFFVGSVWKWETNLVFSLKKRCLVFDVLTDFDLTLCFAEFLDWKSNLILR